ncbi:hypothetical protein [Aggregatibacter actinomycetemcomitans]|uniref:hypothetical protein n=1 Tax=Aggregatibacter actinomycetemcomitans TaxID=714 RepID=UPI0021CCBDDA|nr:hypothetical protein [Aggregatibacter actinomycetemcomitans]
MHIDNITTAPYPQIRLTHYHLSRQDKPASTRTAYLLCLAADTQDYQRQNTSATTPHCEYYCA